MQQIDKQHFSFCSIQLDKTYAYVYTFDWGLQYLDPFFSQKNYEQ